MEIRDPETSVDGHTDPKERAALISEIARWRHRETSDICRNVLSEPGAFEDEAKRRQAETAIERVIKKRIIQRTSKKTMRKREREEPYIHMQSQETNQFKKRIRTNECEPDDQDFCRTREDHMAYPPSKEYPRV